MLRPLVQLASLSSFQVEPDLAVELSRCRVSQEPDRVVASVVLSGASLVGAAEAYRGYRSKILELEDRLKKLEAELRARRHKGLGN